MSQHWTTHDIPDLSALTVVVTGANSGLGLYTSQALAAAGAKVIMACRNLDKAETAAQQIRNAATNADLDIRHLDLSKLASVREFAETVRRDKLKIDRLINNAGIMAVPPGRTTDGFEMQIGTNHFGHFALTGLLIDQLTDDARIVNVASLAHRFTPGIDFEDINWEQRRYNRWQAYGDSKLANLLFTFELQRRLAAAGSGVTVAAAHPGYSATHLQFVAAEQKQSKLEKWFMSAANTAIAQPAEMGALPSLYAACADDVNSGDLIGPDGFQQIRGYPRKVGCRRQARDPALSQTLWNLSEVLTGVRYLN